MMWGRQVAAIACIFVALVAANAQTNLLSWDKTSGRVDANIHHEALWPLLEDISAKTGWQIFVEPGADRVASTKFKDLPAGDALKMLLGDLNFAFVPRVGAQPELYVFRTTMKNATRQVVANKPAKHVPNELIVKVKPGTNIAALARLLGAKIVGSIEKDGIYELQFGDSSATDAALSQLQSNSDVQAVGYNNYFDPPPTAQASSSGGTPLSLSVSPPSTSNGKVTVALIDTGVDARALGADAAQFILPQINADGSSTPSSDSGPTHGTAMAAQILSTIQNIQSTMGNNSTPVQIQPINVYPDSNDQTTTMDVLNGLEQAAQAKIPIINMSLGSSGDSPVLDTFVNQLTSEGYTIFAAAGNTPTGEPYYPAADQGVYAITALGQPGQLASYANTWPDSTMMALPGTGSFIYNGQSWVVQGTSTSTAIASGIDAAYTANGWSQTQISKGMANKWPVPIK